MSSYIASGQAQHKHMFLGNQPLPKLPAEQHQGKLSSSRPSSAWHVNRSTTPEQTVGQHEAERGSIDQAPQGHCLNRLQGNARPGLAATRDMSPCCRAAASANVAVEQCTCYNVRSGRHCWVPPPHLPEGCWRVAAQELCRGGHLLLANQEAFVVSLRVIYSLVTWMLFVQRCMYCHLLLPGRYV